MATALELFREIFGAIFATIYIDSDELRLYISPSALFSFPNPKMLEGLKPSHKLGSQPFDFKLP